MTMLHDQTTTFEAPMIQWWKSHKLLLVRKAPVVLQCHFYVPRVILTRNPSPGCNNGIVVENYRNSFLSSDNSSVICFRYQRKKIGKKVRRVEKSTFVAFSAVSKRQRRRWYTILHSGGIGKPND